MTKESNNGAKPVRGHKRQQASIGLGIITTNLDVKDQSSSQQQQQARENHDEQAGTNDRTKTDAFFSTSTLSVPRPPPPLASSISASSPRRSNDSTHGPISAPIVTNDNEALLDDDDEMGSSRRMTFANRLRYLVAANKMAPPAPSPIPNNYRQHASSSSSTTTTTATTTTSDKVMNTTSGLHPTEHRSYSSSSSSDDDEIMPLPSPAPGSASMHSRQHRLFPKHPIVSPPQLSPVTPTSEDDKPPEHASDNTTTTTTTTASSSLEPPSKSIPVIVTSPSWTPGRPKNKLPSLSEEPMLGDLDDDAVVSTTTNHKLAAPTMNREYKFPSPSPMQYTEEDIVGKQIGDYKIRRLIGVGAFSKVYLATRVKDGTEFAIKMVNKDRIATDARIRSSIEREVGVLKVTNMSYRVHDGMTHVYIYSLLIIHPLCILKPLWKQSNIYAL